VTSAKRSQGVRRHGRQATSPAKRRRKVPEQASESSQTENRRRAILASVEERGFVRTAVLSDELKVSEVSIRKDLQFLERRGLIERIHGGAQLTRHGMALLHLTERYTVNHTAKRKIAVEAARRLDRPGLQIYIDTGTTNALLAEAIPRDLPITIVTNSLSTIAALAGRPACKVITMGGIVNYEDRIFLGPWIESQLERFRFDFAFTGADSVTAEGFGSIDYTYSDMLHHVVTRSRQSYVLADSSKVDKHAANLYARPEEVTAWITDDGVPPALVAAFAATGRPVIVAR
jgi:DeoR/GlpR family transcriptional regulator of sugar metabolism